MFKSGLLTRESPCKSKQVDLEFLTETATYQTANLQNYLKPNQHNSEQHKPHALLDNIQLFSILKTRNSYLIHWPPY